MRCPICKAELDMGPNCRRCRADLSLLFRLEEERASLCSAAARALMSGQGQQAVVLTSAIATLRPGVDAGRLRALGLLLQRDFAGAYLAHREATPDLLNAED